MNLHKAKLLTGVFLLLAYMSIGVFGLFEFSHMAETPMIDCPYSQNEYSVCENSFSHISNWRQFSNVVFQSLFVSSFVILGIILYFFNKSNFLNQKPRLFYRWKHYLNHKKSYTSLDKIIEWLSFFENSPPFSYVRHG